MARLSELKLAMGTSILIAGFVFGIFIVAVLFLLQFDYVTGTILSLAGVGLYILVQYLIGPMVVASSTRLNYVKPGENPWLESTVKELADKDGLPMPRVAVVPSSAPNAFTFGRASSSATLAVHEGLLNNLNKEEIKGVIAHELGHIKHKDYIVMTVLSALPLIAYIVANLTLRAGMSSARYGRRGKKDNSGGALVIIGIISFAVYIVTFLSVMRLSRLREHFADAYSAYLTGSPKSLESALTKISYGLSVAPQQSSQARAFYIEDPERAKQETQAITEKKNEYDLDQDGVLDERELDLAMEKEAKSTWNQLNSLFATHPSTFKRIMLLREIGKEMQTGNYSSDRIYSHI